MPREKRKAPQTPLSAASTTHDTTPNSTASSSVDTPNHREQEHVDSPSMDTPGGGGAADNEFTDGEDEEEVESPGGVASLADRLKMRGQGGANTSTANTDADEDEDEGAGADEGEDHGVEYQEGDAAAAAEEEASAKPASGGGGAKGRKASRGARKAQGGVEGCITPRTYLMNRPYKQHYEGLTPTTPYGATNGGEKGDEADAQTPTGGRASDSDWAPGRGGDDEEENEEDDKWEPDAADDSEGELRSPDASTRYDSDMSCKSGRWCKEISDKVEEEGLTPKAEGMLSRPAHLRYIQSYAEVELEGEGGSDSEYCPDDGAESDALFSP